VGVIVVAVRQIPNLAPAVFLSPTAQLEIVQDGVTMRASAGQIANLNSNANIKILNDIVSTNSYFPLFADINSGETNTLYASDPNYNYIPAEGRLQAMRPEATQGIVYNNSVTSLDYVFPTGDNATSCGPLTLTAAITVPTGSEWMVL
jgi:hypothetical protein